MKLTKCENKHFYDADKFDTCPHCEKAVGSAQDRPDQSISVKPSTGSPPGPSKKKTLSPHTGSIWDQNADPKTANFMDEFDATGEVSATKQSEKPVEITQEREENSPEETSTAPSIAVEESVAENDLEQVTAPASPKPEPTSTPEPKESLQSQVNAVASHGPTEDLKTMAFYNFTDAEPVVGWLVCVTGEYFGESFNLKTGQNFIGRALTMDVPLAKDTSVSRDKHAIVTYDPQNRVFFVQPGDSSGLTYLNDALLLAHQPLKAYEKIKVGKSEFVFVPCCGEQFSWEDYMQ